MCVLCCSKLTLEDLALISWNECAVGSAGGLHWGLKAGIMFTGPF